MYEINIDKVGLESADIAYGGYLNAYSFYETSFEDWFSDFRGEVLSKIGKDFFPIYRMADGEYRFLLGRKLNIHKKPFLKELIAVSAERLHIKNPNKWKTSWGESYHPKEVKRLRQKLVDDLRYIADKGLLACYYNNNGLKAFMEFNKYLPSFFKKNAIRFDQTNYIPFHFVCGLLVSKGWQQFYLKKHILIVSGTDDESEIKITSTLLSLGAKKVSFLRISKISSLEERLDLSKVDRGVEIGLVAAGIGSANILRQLEPLKTLVLDIGGYINCYIDSSTSQHGGIFKLPN